MQSIRKIINVDPALARPTPANDVDAAMARVVMPIGDEEALAWDAVVESRLPKAA